MAATVTWNLSLILVVALAVVVLVDSVAANPATLPTTFSVAEASPLASSNPEVGTFGFNVNGMDRSVAPGDDFVRYAVGKWIDTTEIPPDRSSLGSVAIIRENVSARVRGIIEEAAKADMPEGSDTRKIGDYFTSFMDEAQIEQLGASPVKAELDAIAAIHTR